MSSATNVATLVAPAVPCSHGMDLGVFAHKVIDSDTEENVDDTVHDAVVAQQAVHSVDRFDVDVYAVLGQGRPNERGDFGRRSESAFVDRQSSASWCVVRPSVNWWPARLRVSSKKQQRID